MRAPEQTSEGWDGAAEAYEAVIMPFTSQYAEEAIRMADVGPEDRVLDVAAGAGAATLAAVRRGAEVVATDFAPAMIQRLDGRLAAEGISRVRTEVMDGQALELADDSFDVVVSVLGLIFFPDRAKGFSEMHRVLKRGGRGVVVSWSAPDRVPVVSDWGKAARRAIPDLPPSADPPIFSLSDSERFRAEMEAAGFADVAITPVTKTWTLGTPEQYWESFQGASPVFAELVENRPESLDDVREAFVGMMREQHGDDVRLECEALVGLGRK